MLGSIQAFTHWLSELYLSSERNNSQYSESVLWFISVIVEATYPLMARDIPEKVVLSACQLLLSLATTVRPKFGLSLPGVKGLMKKAKDGELGDIPQRVRRVSNEIFISLSLSLSLSLCRLRAWYIEH